MFVAVSEGRVVGMVSGVLYSHPDKPREMWIPELGVAPPYRRQGLARSLLEAITRHAREAGCGSCWLLTEPANAEANALYRSLPGWAGPRPQSMYEIELGRDGS